MMSEIPATQASPARVRRALRRYAAQVATQSGLAESLSWDALSQLPTWVAFKTTDECAIHTVWCGALWHQPALQRCIDAAVLHVVDEILGPGAISILLSVESAGRQHMMPLVDEMAQTFFNAGQVLMLSALPPVWREPFVNHWGWGGEVLSLVNDHGAEEMSDPESALVCEMAAELLSTRSQGGEIQ